MKKFLLVATAVLALIVPVSAMAIDSPPIPGSVSAAFATSAKAYAKSHHMTVRCYALTGYTCSFFKRGAPIDPKNATVVDGKAHSAVVLRKTIQPVVDTGAEYASPSCLHHQEDAFGAETGDCDRWQQTCLYQVSSNNTATIVNVCKPGWKRKL